MHRFFLALTILVFTTVCFAQENTPADAVPDTTNGKDFAGRPVNDAQVPAEDSLSKAAQERFEQGIKDVHFDFDRADLRMDQRQILAADADWLKAHPDLMIVIEGDADERGDIVYNLDLSDRRAITTRDALVQLGVPEDHIVFATGWGKLYPICEQSDESCWSQNRRGHIEPWEPLNEMAQLASK